MRVDVMMAKLTAPWRGPIEFCRRTPFWASVLLYAMLGVLASLIYKTGDVNRIDLVRTTLQDSAAAGEIEV